MGRVWLSDLGERVRGGAEVGWSPGDLTLAWFSAVFHLIILEGKVNRERWDSRQLANKVKNAKNGDHFGTFFLRRKKKYIRP